VDRWERPRQYPEGRSKVALTGNRRDRADNLATPAGVIALVFAPHSCAPRRLTRPGVCSRMSVPTISSVPLASVGLQRPKFSVMIPVYKPLAHLEIALGSVLVQGVQPRDMQIAIVDDGSDEDITARVRALDPSGRVEIHRFPGRIGLARNLNRSIDLSRGHLVHLLHQDDYVLPGFYSGMLRAFERVPAAGMAFCRTRIVDGSGRLQRVTSGPRLWSGVVNGWVSKIATRQRVQAPSAVVARSTYEQVGGYREDLRFALDWEMWVRIAVRHAVWYERKALAAYRRHARSETARVRTDALAWPDVCHAIRLNSAHCRSWGHSDVSSISAAWYTRSAMRDALREHLAGRTESARRTVAQCRDIIALMGDARSRGALERRLAAVQCQLGCHESR